MSKELSCWYQVYLLYWYESANADVLPNERRGATGGGRGATECALLGGDGTHERKRTECLFEKSVRKLQEKEQRIAEQRNRALIES